MVAELRSTASILGTLGESGSSGIRLLLKLYKIYMHDITQKLLIFKQIYFKGYTAFTLLIKKDNFNSTEINL